MNLIHFHPESIDICEKTTAWSTSDLLPKHPTSEISLKTSDLMLKHQTWQHCLAQWFLTFLRTRTPWAFIKFSRTLVWRQVVTVTNVVHMVSQILQQLYKALFLPHKNVTLQHASNNCFSIGTNACFSKVPPLSNQALLILRYWNHSPTAHSRTNYCNVH